MEKTLRSFGPEMENRARTILRLQDLACNRRALPARVEHLWRAENFAPTVPYTGSFLMPLGQGPDMVLLQESIAAVVQRHEALHSRLGLEDGAAFLVPEKPDGESLQLSKVTRADIAAHRSGVPGSPLADFFRTPIKLQEQTGFRCRAFQDEDRNVSLAILMHHYFGDAWSSQIIRREIETLYAARRQGGDAALPPVTQYSEYALFQRQALQKNLPRYLNYWHRQLEDAPPSHPPFDQQGSPEFLGRAHFLIEDALMQKLAATGKNLRLSLAVMCFAGFQIALAKWYGVKQIASAVQLADRIRPQFRDTVGYLLTAIALNTRLADNMTMAEFLPALAREIYDGVGHQDLAFELYDEIFAPPQPFCTPRFNFTPRRENFYVGDNENSTPSITGVQPASDIRKTSAYRDLQFLIIEYPQGLVGRAVYNKNLSFEKVAQVIEIYKKTLAGMASDPQTTLGQFL